MDMVSLRATMIAVLTVTAGSCDGEGTRPSTPSSSATHIGAVSPKASTPPSAIATIPFDRCPVTQPGDRGSPPPAAGKGWLSGYVSGLIGVNLFDFHDSRDHRVGDWLLYKVPWQALAEGDLDVTVVRLDEAGEGIGQTTKVHGDGPVPAGGQLFAGEVRVPAGPGCWAVTGKIGQDSLTFVFRATT